MNPSYFNLVSTRSTDGDHVALQRWYSDHVGILWGCDSLLSATLLRRETSEGNEADYICCYGFPDEAGFLVYEHGPARQAAITAAGYEPVLFDAVPLAAEALTAGTIDAWMVNAAEAPRLSTETPGLRIVDTYVGVIVNYGMIGVAHGEVELMGTILQALEGLKIDGTLDAIADRWSVPRAPF